MSGRLAAPLARKARRPPVGSTPAKVEEGKSALVAVLQFAMFGTGMAAVLAGMTVVVG
jgi:hypothetical protein